MTTSLISLVDYINSLNLDSSIEITNIKNDVSSKFLELSSLTTVHTAAINTLGNEMNTMANDINDIKFGLDLTSGGLVSVSNNLSTITGDVNILKQNSISVTDNLNETINNLGILAKNLINTRNEMSTWSKDVIFDISLIKKIDDDLEILFADLGWPDNVSTLTAEPLNLTNF